MKIKLLSLVLIGLTAISSMHTVEAADPKTKRANAKGSSTNSWVRKGTVVKKADNIKASDGHWDGMPTYAFKVETTSVWKNPSAYSYQRYWKGVNAVEPEGVLSPSISGVEGFDKFGVIFKPRVSRKQAKIYRSTFKYSYKPYLKIYIYTGITDALKLPKVENVGEAGVRLYIRENTQKSVLGNNGVYRYQTTTGAGFTATMPSLQYGLITLPSVEFEPTMPGANSIAYDPGVLHDHPVNSSERGGSATAPITYLLPIAAQVWTRVKGGPSSYVKADAGIWLGLDDAQVSQPDQSQGGASYPDVTAAFEFGNP